MPLSKLETSDIMVLMVYSSLLAISIPSIVQTCTLSGAPLAVQLYDTSSPETKYIGPDMETLYGEIGLTTRKKK